MSQAIDSNLAPQEQTAASTSPVKSALLKNWKTTAIGITPCLLQALSHFHLPLSVQNKLP